MERSGNAQSTENLKVNLLYLLSAIRIMVLISSVKIAAIGMLKPLSSWVFVARFVLGSLPHASILCRLVI